MLERKKLSSSLTLIAAAVRSDNGSYAQRVGSDHRKLPAPPVKVRAARTRDAGELLWLCCLATTTGHDRSTITGRVCGKLDSFHGSSATG